MTTHSAPALARLTRAGSTLAEVALDTARDLLDVAASTRAGIGLALDDLAGRTR